VEQGCQSSLGTSYQNGKNTYTKKIKDISNGYKIYQMATKYIKWPENRPNGHKVYRRISLQDPPKVG
jgi:hypothetical protein